MKSGGKGEGDGDGDGPSVCARIVAPEAILNDRPAQVKAAAEVKQKIGLLLSPTRVRQVLLVLDICEAQDFYNLVKASKRV